MATTTKRPKTSNIHARVNPDVRKDAEEILNAMGMSISDYINLALYQVRITRKVPFELVAEPPFPYEWLPNLEQDLKEAHEAVANGAKTYKTAAELRAALDAENNDE